MSLPKLPTGVGSYREQKRFIERNAAFLAAYPRLNRLSKKVFLRALKNPDAKEVERLLTLPEDDVAVIPVEGAPRAQSRHHLSTRQS